MAGFLLTIASLLLLFPGGIAKADDSMLSFEASMDASVPSELAAPLEVELQEVGLASEADRLPDFLRHGGWTFEDAQNLIKDFEQARHDSESAAFQWCRDANDPRCMPAPAHDPTGSQSHGFSKTVSLAFLPARLDLNALIFFVQAAVDGHSRRNELGDSQIDWRPNPRPPRS